jgi:predicted RNase H-like HicB family nuclease
LRGPGSAPQRIEDGTYVAEVPDLRGVLATGATLEACRANLGEVIEEWALVRISQGLPVPPLGDVTVAIKHAS